MEVIVDWIFLAAHRAAKRDHTSADSKLNYVIAFLAIHENQITPEKLINHG
jgi:hypothetical protein